MALTRDVFFLDYEEHPLTIAAAEDLSKFSDFRGPRFPRTNSRLNPRGLRRPGDALSVEAEAQDESQAGASAPTEAESLSAIGPNRTAQTGRVTTFTLFRGNTTGDAVGP